MSRPSVLLVFGGESSEHDISLSSARNVYAAIDNTQFHVEPVYIDKHGKWWLLESFGQEVSLEGAVQLVPALGVASFVTLPYNRIIKPDVILPILHGKNGEDGAIQGLARLLHIPIVGCDMEASSVCMDKITTKVILAHNGIEVVPYEAHHVGQPEPDSTTLEERLGFPLFIKPARSGSSIGVSRVTSAEQLAEALATAHEHDTVALIEKGMVARELEVAVLGNPPHHTTSKVGEIHPDGDFYSYDAKYAASSMSGVIVPANLDSGLAHTIRKTAERAYELLGCEGMARVDFFLTEGGVLYVNEVNTIPGFTNISMYPKLWQASGVTYSKLIEKLIRLALHKKH
jgi:D-alanine-D-alanine ligase